MTLFDEAIEAAQYALIADSCDMADRMPSQEGWDLAGDDARLSLYAALSVLLPPLRELAEHGTAEDLIGLLDQIESEVKP